MTLPPGLLLTFYGDDFTGSSAVMEVLTAAGLRTMLFLRPPTAADLARYPDLRAVGVAGMSRTMSPAEMDDELLPAFSRLAALKAPVFHYKICSTFDSSPKVGSIGHAIDIGQRVFDSTHVPLVVAAPAIRRYCLFGNLFATVAGETHRLDRHPVMRVHPTTPMDESDLRQHLGKQTDRGAALMDLLALTGSAADIDARWEALRASRRPGDIVLFDVLDEARLATVGRLIWESRGERPLFTVGSQGLEYALVAHFRAAGLIPAAQPAPRAAAVEQLLVVSGSCSPVTEGQIARALEAGFAGVELDTPRIVDPATRAAALDETRARAQALLADGKDVVVFSARGPKDPRIAEARAAAARTGATVDVGRTVGEALGGLLRTLLERRPLRRAVIAGGDTSGHGASALGVQALELLGPAAAGSPLCRAHAPGQPIDGLELVLKGGQMGDEELFVNVKSGRL